jgi:hypothetical protein
MSFSFRDNGAHHVAMPLARLNSRQRDILDRIGAGEAITRSDSDLVLTIYALRNRHLVETPRAPGGRWTARLTEAGRFLLDHGHLPEDSRMAAAAPRGDSPAKASKSSTPKQGFTPRPSKRSSMARVDPVKDVLMATRKAVKGRPDDSGLLHIGGTGVVTMKVSRGSAPRAIRIVESLLTLAHQRGMTVRNTAPRPSIYMGKEPEAVGVEVVHLGFGTSIRIEEETDRAPHIPTASERRSQARSSWTRVPEWDRSPSGRLRLILPDDQPRNGTPARARFADGKRSALEAKVEAILDEILARAEQRDAQRREKTRLDALYADARQRAVEVATAEYFDDLRAEHARRQVEQWAEADTIRRFVTEMRKRPKGLEEPWLDWVQAHADRIDPPEAAPQAPPMPEPPSEYDLRDYLTSWPVQRPFHWDE